jgi:hypothetical protein
VTTSVTLPDVPVGRPPPQGRRREPEFVSSGFRNAGRARFNMESAGTQSQARAILVPAVISHRGLLHDEHIDQFVLSSPIHAEIMKVFEMFEKA